MKPLQHRGSILGMTENENLSVNGYRTGDRVRSTRWGSIGTVKVIPVDPCDYEEVGAIAIAEVRWDDSIVADELALVESHLMRITNSSQIR